MAARPTSSCKRGRRDRAARLYEEAGLTHFLAITNFGDLEAKKVLRSMELMARHVFPAFR